MASAKILPGEELTAERAKIGQPPLVPATTRDRGDGPHQRLVLRGATVIDGTGAPPIGPVDLVVEKGRIVQMKKVGASLSTIKQAIRPAPGDREIDCHGKWLTPGFVDCHAHAGVAYHAANGWVPPVDYVYKLWLAHGVTTVREMGSFNGLGWMLDQKKLAEKGTIAAPRMLSYCYFPAVNDMLKTIHTPDEARAWIRGIAKRGADGVKFFGAPPNLMQAALDECAKVGLRSGCHHAQMAVTRMNALTTAGWGLTSAEHYYGLPEALYEDRIVQQFPADYDYSDEYFRFSVSGQMFAQAAEPGSKKWEETLEAFLALGFTFVPTFTIYDANRDLMRARQADWHKEYTWKSMWEYFKPQRGGHGSYWYRWSTQNEIEWKDQYRRWMAFINDYKNRGGRVCTGSDSGFIFQIYGFGYIRELELLQEAGFNPLEVLRAATIQGASLCGLDDEIGSLEVGKRADILVHDVNPLTDFKLLYGTGALRLNEGRNTGEYVRGLRYTIANGIVYDTAELLADVRELVAKSWEGEEPMQAVVAPSAAQAASGDAKPGCAPRLAAE
jgi:imidazolonepropionase